MTSAITAEAPKCPQTDFRLVPASAEPLWNWSRGTVGSEEGSGRLEIEGLKAHISAEPALHSLYVTRAAAFLTTLSGSW